MYIVYRFEDGEQVNVARFASEQEAIDYAELENTDTTVRHFYYFAY